ncbi:hypothetical protein [Streptacidiphilus sp. EB103A]|uniref:hypothetical protein n=1 Tax=Streptacidiphilus sp. EB103A TaxID=3156275 RepID=UPI0035184F99
MAPPAAISTAPIPANRPASLPPPVLASEVPLGEGEAVASTEVDAEADAEAEVLATTLLEGDAEALGFALLDADAEGVVGTTTGAEEDAEADGEADSGADSEGLGEADLLGDGAGEEQSPPGTAMVFCRWPLISTALA